MNVTPLELPDVLLIQPERHEDARGSLIESWEKHRYSRQVTAADFVQDNVSVTAAGAIRGLHFQHPDGQGKLITVVAGAAFDVVLDVRRGSPSFGNWISAELSADNGRQLWVPPGFAHGFQSLADGTTLIYKTTARWQPGHERTVLYSDPSLAIPWPRPVGAVSAKDAAAQLLALLPLEFLPQAS